MRRGSGAWRRGLGWRWGWSCSGPRGPRRSRRRRRIERDLPPRRPGFGAKVTNERGYVVARHDFLPFGQEWTLPTSRDKKLFTGQEHDRRRASTTSAHATTTRRIGRFATIDPVYTWRENLVDPQRWNRYAYAKNNPLRYTDPDGRMPWLIVGGFVGTVAYGGWDIWQNVQSGRPWHENLGVEAAKGFIVGATLGIAAPALAAGRSPSESKA